METDHLPPSSFGAGEAADGSGDVAGGGGQPAVAPHVVPRRPATGGSPARRGAAPRVAPLAVAVPPRRAGRTPTPADGSGPADQRRRRSVGRQPRAPAAPPAGELHRPAAGPDPAAPGGGRRLRRRRHRRDGRSRRGVPWRPEPSPAGAGGAAGDHVDAADREGARPDRAAGRRRQRGEHRRAAHPRRPHRCRDAVGGRRCRRQRRTRWPPAATRRSSAASRARRIPNPPSDLDVDGAAGFEAMLDLWFPPVGPDDDPIAALHALSGRGELVGQPFEPTARQRCVRRRRRARPLARRGPCRSWC